MNWYRIKGRWRQLLGEAKKRWGTLTDDERAQHEANRDILLGRLQALYGINVIGADRMTPLEVAHLQLHRSGTAIFAPVERQCLARRGRQRNGS